MIWCCVGLLLGCGLPEFVFVGLVCIVCCLVLV